MNRSRSNKSKLFGKRNVRGFLPKVPCDVPIEPWWRVEIGMVLEEDIKVIFLIYPKFSSVSQVLKMAVFIRRWSTKKNWN